MSSLFDILLKKSGKMLSPDQMAAVDSRVATVVSAGAGSGKTTVLSFRFLKLVLEGVPADKILTLTFTKKAAAEMYERIHFLLSVAAEEDSKYLEQLTVNFPKSHISTMDSFWTEIARTDCMKYGILRDFSIMSEDDLEQAVSRIINDMYSDKKLSETLSEISDDMKESDLKSAFTALARKSSIISDYSYDDLKDGFSDFIRIVDDEWKHPREILQYALIDDVGGLRGTTKSTIFDSGGTFEMNMEAYEKREYRRMTKFKKNIKNEELKIAFDKFNNALEKTWVLEDLEQAYNSGLPLVKLFVYFLKKLNKEKRRLGLLTFKDVQATAKRILLDNKSVRDYYKDKFDFIMIDEFQDNDKEQKEMLYLLSEDKEKHSEGIPLAEDLDRKKLFFVGDDKQSIYLFRGADVSVFNNLKDEVVCKMGGKYLTLDANYRSEPKLVEHFDTVFSEVFSNPDPVEEDSEKIVGKFSNTEFASFSASASPIVAGRKSCGIEPVIELNILQSPDGEKAKDEEKTEFEAEVVADKIEEILSSPEFMLPGKNGEKRAPTFDDIGILYSKTKTQMPIERALRKRGIPYTVMESTSMTLEGLAYDIYSFLQLLIYPSDKKSFMDVLVSPFGRISNEGIKLLIDLSCPNYFDFDYAFSNPTDIERFNSLRSLYKECAEEAGRESVCQTLERLYYESGYRTYLLSSSLLSEYDEHFSYLWTIAANIDREGGNIISYLDYIRPLIGHAEKLSELDIQRLNSTGVKMMTIHKSKGLEFPIVIVAGLGSKQKDQESKNNIVDTKHNGMPYLMHNKQMASFFNRHKFSRLKAERKRVLYVALTRAINHLVMTANDHDFEKQGGVEVSEASMYMNYMKAVGNIDPEKSGVRIKYIPVKNDDMDEFVPSVNQKRSEKWYEESELASSAVYKEVKAGVKAVSHEEFDFKTVVEGPLLPSFAVDGILASFPDARADFGTLVHEYLERTIKGEPLYDFIREYMSDKECLQLQKEAMGIVERFLKSEFYSKYVEPALEKSTEVGFYFYSDDMVLEGSADLLLSYEKYNLIVDYKTDAHKSPEIHKGQLTRYAKALTDLTKKPCYGIVCYVRDFSEGPVWDASGEEVQL